MNRRKNFFSCLIPAAAFFGVQLLVVFCVEFCIGFYSGLINRVDLIVSATPFVLCLTTLFTTIFGVIWFSKTTKDAAKVSAKGVVKASSILWIVILGLGLVLMTNLLSLIAPFFPNAFDAYDDMFSEAGIGTNWAVMLVAAFVAPIGEECIFRGLTLERALKNYSFLRANILQAVLFGLVHGNLIQGSYAFILGIVLGYVYQSYGVIFMSILLHAVFNILGQLLPYLYPESSSPVLYVCLVVIGCLLTVAAFIKIESETKQV